MTDTDPPPAEVTEALNRLSHAMEQLQGSYARSQRANRRLRVAMVIVLLLLAGAAYRVTMPIFELTAQIPQLIPQLKKKAILDPEEAREERQRLMEKLTPEQQEAVLRFEEDLEWLSRYLDVYPDFSAGAAVSLFLSNMSGSIKVMPDLYEQVQIMTAEVQAMNNELHTMNGKMDALPVLAGDVKGMNHQMNALPVLATEVKAMNFHMSIMSRGMDSTMGEAGRMMPWNW
jgi:hypothetical protein